MEHSALKQSSFISIESNKNGGTQIEKGAFALVVTATNELQLFLPATADDDAVFPQYALALIAVANKLKDIDWVERLLVEEFGPKRL